ncbi:alkaline shock response membrane anchor protein AmaP [Streptomyces sp. NPDC088812]|uniref:alkaline shock response membrane anchor protein AmaP n=1 Tax=Streptomyces sp. NPDC088812 TaxID=3365905 RepID=UPI003810DE08
MTPRPALNRSVLALAGLVLLGGGLLILFAGLDLYRRHDLVPPAGWPLTAPDDVLLGSADRARWSSQGWWWPAVIAALVLAALLALWWLLAQLSRRRLGFLPVGGTPPQEGVELRDRALSDAIANEASALPGVDDATVRITGRPAHPRTPSRSPSPPRARPAPPSVPSAKARSAPHAGPPASLTCPPRSACTSPATSPTVRSKGRDRPFPCSTPLRSFAVRR